MNVKRQIRHSNVSITQSVYRHLVEEAHPEQRKRLDKILGFAKATR
jgi:hypothetical protein